MNEQRRNQRFDLKLPIELIRAGSDLIPQVGETRNVSSGGVLFTADRQLSVGDPIEYFVTLPTQHASGMVRLRCMGKVTRVEDRRPREPEPVAARYAFSIAATLERHEFVRR